MTPLLPLLLALAAPLRIGFGTADITPPAGYRMAGSYGEVFATGTHDPLFAKVVYFEQGDTRFVLIVCDVCGQERTLTDAIRSRLEKECGVPAAHVAVTATHTHAGPMHYDPILLDCFRLKYGATDDASDPKEVGGYRKRFVELCSQAATTAKAAAKPVTLSAGTATVPGLAFNRRYRMRDGTTGWNPGKENPNIVAPLGPTDDGLPVLLASIDGKPIGGLTAFAMHTTSYSGRTFSADHPGHLQAELRKTYGPDFVSVFGEGCAGNTNQVNTGTKEPDPTPEAIGRRLATAYTGIAYKPVTAPGLAVKVGTVKAPLKPARPADLPAMREKLSAGKAKFLELVEAYQVLLTDHYRAKHGDAVPLDVQAVRLGSDAAVVLLPHEVFVEFGLRIKAESPFRTTLVVTIANEVDCYVPTRAAFAEGHYEPVNSPYLPGVGELLADEAVRLLKSMK